MHNWSSGGGGGEEAGRKYRGKFITLHAQLKSKKKYKVLSESHNLLQQKSRKRRQNES